MALTPGLLTRQRTLAAKLQTATSTPISLSGTDGAFNAFNSKIKPDFKANEREGQGSLSNLDPIPGPSEGSSDFETELTNSGTTVAPILFSTLLPACGFSPAGGTGSLTPTTGSGVVLTLGQYIAGQLLSISDAVGKFVLTLEAGKPGRFKFSFNGIWQPPSATALITPTFPSVAPPLFAGASLTIATVTYRIPKVEITVENTIAMLESGTAVDSASVGTGIYSYQITARKIGIKLSAGAQPLGTKNWWADHRNVTAAALALTVGSGSHGQVSIAAPRMIHLEAPQEESDNGVYVNSLNFLCASTAGDDELTFALA